MKLNILNFLAWLVMLMLVPSVATNAQPVLRPSAKTLKEALPGRVSDLFEWPAESVLSGTNRVRGDENHRIVLAKKMSIYWLKKILNPKWVPEAKTWPEENLIMIRNEFGPFDVTRVEWQKNGYVIQVSQTAGIIAIELTPLQPKKMATVDQRIAFAAELASQVLHDTGMRHGLDDKGRPVKVPVRDLGRKVRGYSFRPELVRQFPDGIAGVCATPEQEGLVWTKEGRDIDAESRANNENWDKSFLSWSYWWRHVCWWHDGKSVGLFTLKTEAGSWGANYWDNFGSRWFEGRRSRKSGRKKQ